MSQHQQIEPTAAREINLAFLGLKCICCIRGIVECCTDSNVDMDDDNKLGADLKNWSDLQGMCISGSQGNESLVIQTWNVLSMSFNQSSSCLDIGYIQTLMNGFYQTINNIITIRLLRLSF